MIPIFTINRMLVSLYLLPFCLQSACFDFLLGFWWCNYHYHFLDYLLYRFLQNIFINYNILIFLQNDCWCDADSLQWSQTFSQSPWIPSFFLHWHGYLRLRESHFSCIPVIFNTICMSSHSVSTMYVGQLLLAAPKLSG